MALSGKWRPEFADWKSKLCPREKLMWNDVLKTILLPKVSKLLNFKNKERILWKFCAEKQGVFKVKKNLAVLGFPHSNTWMPENSGTVCINFWGKESMTLKCIHSQVMLQLWRERQIFLRVQKLREFIAHRPSWRKKVYQWKSVN